jgi:F0F1-type ATP synthase alpha subunit
VDFHARLEQLFKTEMKQNKAQLKNYLTLPHNHFTQPEPTKVHLRFLDELPKIYKKREEEMIEKIKKTLVTDEHVNEMFESIVNNANHSFKEKIEALR